MFNRRLARVFSFFAVLVLVFTMASSPAYAISKQSFAAWVASAIQAINITVGSTFIPAANLGSKWNDYLSAPVQITQNQVVDLPYTFSQNDIDEYLSRSVIKIDKDTVNIDGVDYSNIWLSSDAAEKFRVNAFDVVNAWDIASQSEGTFVTGVGTYDGIPIYELPNGDKVSQVYGLPANPGNSSFYLVETYTPSGYPQRYKGTWRLSDGTVKDTNGSTRDSDPVVTVQIKTQHAQFSGGGYTGTTTTSNGPASLWDNTPFDFDWVAGYIPPDEPISSDEGLNIRVPTSVINQWYVDYPDTGDNVTYNMGDPELTTKIDDLIDLIIPLIPILDIDFQSYPDPEPEPEPEPVPEPEPYPDPDPQPGVVLPDIDWSDLFRTIKNIYHNISISNSWLESIKNILDKIKWSIDDILDWLENLPETILQDIEQGPIKIFDKAIDLFKSIFLPFFLPLKLALSIWEYVTGWLQYLWYPWQLFSSILPIGFQIPIFGTFAAYVCISIFKKVIH